MSGTCNHSTIVNGRCIDCGLRSFAEETVAELRARVEELKALFQRMLAVHWGWVALEAQQRKRIEELEARLERVISWTHAYGSEMIPSRGDTYGEGVRDCKARVGWILAVADEEECNLRMCHYGTCARGTRGCSEMHKGKETK